MPGSWLVNASPCRAIVSESIGIILSLARLTAYCSTLTYLPAFAAYLFDLSAKVASTGKVLLFGKH